MGDDSPRHPARTGPGRHGPPGRTAGRRIPHGPLDLPVAVALRRWENVSVACRGGGRTRACDHHPLPDQQDRQVLEHQMKVVYDPEVDVLSVLLSDAPVAESDQDKPGVILDYDAGGNMVGFEILDASRRMSNPMSVEYAVTPPLRRPA